MNVEGLEHGEAIVTRGASPHEATHVDLVSSPLLAALRRAGTAHVYADTADVIELSRTLTVPERHAIVAEVDGNTVNQPLVAAVVDRYLTDPSVVRDLADMRHRCGDDPDARVVTYATLCARIGNDVVARCALGRTWDVSLQLHTAAGGAVAAAVARALHRAVPGVLVKVAFTPHAPECLILARSLEHAGIPVNFTATFSARQVVVAALLANPSRTNVFLGRLNEGLDAEMLGEHVCLEAQRQLRALRRATRTKTELIVASMRAWETFLRVAGCDAFTAPCGTLGGFLAQHAIAPVAIVSQLETSYEDRLDIARRTYAAIPIERIARLYRVEPELVTFATEFGRSLDWSAMRDGATLARRFEDEGFGDFFYAPPPAEWRTMHTRKLPDLTSPLTRTIALDTLYSLLADADFENHQATIDATIDAKIAHAIGS
jgi:transaldolase